MGFKVSGPLRGHALTSFDGVFLSADGAFSEIVGRSIPSLQKLTILDVTHEGDRASNHERLDRLRETGESFEIVKRYVRDDGRLLHVRNHVSSFRDGTGPTRIVASVEMLDRPQDPASEHGQFALAKALLRHRLLRSDPQVAASLTDRAWDIVLALYLLEQEGARTLLADICRAASVEQSAGFLTLLELIGRDWIDLDRRGIGLADSGAILTAAGRAFLTRHLHNVLAEVASPARA